MDDRTAQRMHALLKHREAEWPSSCPVCLSQAPEPPPAEPEPTVIVQTDSLVRDRG